MRRGTLAVVATFVPAFIPLEKPVSNPSFPLPLSTAWGKHSLQYHFSGQPQSQIWTLSELAN